MDIGSEIWHEAFSLFSLIVIHVARGKRIALAPAVLASIYRDMTLLKGKIAESTLLRIPKGKHDGLTVELWSSMHLVQVGVWKRFGELRRPGPNLMKSGYPRLAWWDKLKQEVENVLLVLDSGKESFSSGELGFPQVLWRNPSFWSML